MPFTRRPSGDRQVSLLRGLLGALAGALLTLGLVEGFILVEGLALAVALPVFRALVGLLTRLEMEDKIVSLPGKRYRRA